MKFFSICKKAGLAVVFLLTAQLAQAGAPPSPSVTIEFGAEVLFGDYTGAMGSGSFTYEPDFLDMNGDGVLGQDFGLLEFKFDILGFHFNIDDDIDFPEFPTVEFFGDTPVAADFVAVRMLEGMDVGIGVGGPFSSDPIALPGGAMTSTEHDDFYIEAFIEPEVVPVPPAIWLFGSGLLGLVGMARRKKAA